MKKSEATLSDREPAVAGRFYPSDKAELRSEILQLNHQAEKLSEEVSHPDGQIMALLSPHAGYVFSGIVAASAFHTLYNQKNIERVFLIGSSHHEWFQGASIYHSGNYKTPLGKVRVDRQIASELISRHSEFSYVADAHRHEHSLEVQLPFLIEALGNNFTIVPILIGSHVIDTLLKIAIALKPYFTKGNLFVISTDLSHYPNYYDAVKTDKLTIEALRKNDPEEFLRQVKENESGKVPNLSTCMCGWTSVLTLLYITQGDPEIIYQPILYSNSGDTPIYGDKQRVVGYQSLAVIRKNPEYSSELSFTEQEKELLIGIARNAISSMLDNRKNLLPDEDTLSQNLKGIFGAFVSVYIDHKLRGCIGRLETSQPLYQTINSIAKAAAMHDTRFEPVSVDEIDTMTVEISVLTPLKKVESIDEIVPGKHGVLIRKDYKSGTFLPQVARRTGWDTIELLRQCSERKAGLGPDGWKNADIFIYEAIIIEENKEK
jgi:hypothetical protein